MRYRVMVIYAPAPARLDQALEVPRAAGVDACSPALPRRGHIYIYIYIYIYLFIYIERERDYSDSINKISSGVCGGGFWGVRRPAAPRRQADAWRADAVRRMLRS